MQNHRESPGVTGESPGGRSGAPVEGRYNARFNPRSGGPVQGPRAAPEQSAPVGHVEASTTGAHRRPPARDRRPRRGGDHRRASSTWSSSRPPARAASTTSSRPPARVVDHQLATGDHRRARRRPPARDRRPRRGPHRRSSGAPLGQVPRALPRGRTARVPGTAPGQFTHTHLHAPDALPLPHSPLALDDPHRRSPPHPELPRE